LRKDCLTVGYNTTTRWHFCTPKEDQQPRWPIASNNTDAKWNYAFWLHNEEVVIDLSYGEHADPVGINLRNQWIESLGLWYSDQEEDNDFERTIELGSEISQEFKSMVLRVAKRLHNTGVMRHVFGRDVLIIVHDLEYSGAEDWTRDANPSGLTTEFEQWVLSGGL
jgi:hypothetical protein